MSSEELKSIIQDAVKQNDLEGSSFEKGSGLLYAARKGFFDLSPPEDTEDIERALAEEVAYQLDTDAENVYELLSLRAMVEIVDVSVMESIVNNYKGIER